MALKDYLAAIPETRIEQRRVPLELEPTRILREHESSPVLFENLGGARAVGNLWGDRVRIARFLGTDPQGLMDRILHAMDHPMPPQETDAAPFLARSTRDVELSALPIPKFYPGDAGRYITAGMVVAESDDARNLSYHRMLLLDDTRMAIRLVPRHLYALYAKARDAGEELPFVMVIGTGPATMLAGGMSFEFGKDELSVANALQGQGTGPPLTVTRLGPRLCAPTDAEYVLVGRLTLETTTEGPFVDILGTYDAAREQPVAVIERICHVEEALFQLVLPGGREHFFLMGLPREPMILRAVRNVVPQVHGVRLTEGGCCWFHGIVSITKQREGDGVNAILAAFGGHPSMKMVTVVDADIDVNDDLSVEWAVATRFQGHRGLVVIEKARGSSLDPSAMETTTTKVGVDATKPLGAAGFERASLEEPGPSAARRKA